MVSVESVYKNVLALSRKGSTGYSSSDDFNEQQRLVQDTLFAWYFDSYERNQVVPDALRPFLKEPTLACSGGNVALPSDYRHRIECQFVFIAASGNTVHPCPYLPGNEEAATLDSYIRKPSADKRRFYHKLLSTGIKVLPGINGALKLKYLCTPPDANRAFTVDTVNYVENPNPGASIDFQWPSQEEGNLVDIFLYLKGISTRQSELLTWVAQKKQFTS